MDLTVKCSYSGCSWTGELRAVEKHQSECLLKVVKCRNSGCTEELTKQDLRDHLVKCSWRKVSCKLCQTIFIRNQDLEHYDVCPKYPVQCAHCCFRDIPREKFDVHVRDECPATEVQCEYKNLGCEAVFPRSNAKSHSKIQVEHHLNLALRGLEATQIQVKELVSLVNKQSQQIELLMSKFPRSNAKSHSKIQVEHHLNLALRGLEATQIQVKELVSLVNKQSQQIELLMSKFPRLNAKSHSETQVEHHLNLALHDHDLQTTQLQVNELVSLVKEQQRQIEQLKEKAERLDNPPFVWKIPNFKTVYEKAVTGEQEVTFSEPFHLFRCGYRLKIKMRPNGGASNPQLNKKFKGKYMSLYIIVVPGDYDWMLPWPISEEICATLIDQNPLQHLRENISKVINFGSGPVLRPLKDDDVSGVGIGTFVEQNVLPTRSYLYNDTVFIMVNKNNEQ
ncbi:hypothetical protein ACROYT_G042197 [Oculina patagonica]